MAGMTYPQVLQVAKQLAPDAQWDLAEALLHHLRSNLPAQMPSPETQGLELIIGLTDTELRALADAVVTDDRQERLQRLLSHNRARPLTQEEDTTLNDLLDEADQVALLKARALYSIQLFGLEDPMP